MNSSWIKIEASVSIHGDVIIATVRLCNGMGAAGPLILALTLWLFKSLQIQPLFEHKNAMLNLLQKL